MYNHFFKYHFLQKTKLFGLVYDSEWRFLIKHIYNKKFSWIMVKKQFVKYSQSAFEKAVKTATLVRTIFISVSNNIGSTFFFFFVEALISNMQLLHLQFASYFSTVDKLPRFSYAGFRGFFNVWKTFPITTDCQRPKVKIMSLLSLRL